MASATRPATAAGAIPSSIARCTCGSVTHIYELVKAFGSMMQTRFNRQEGGAEDLGLD